MFCRSGAKALRQSRCFSTTATRHADFTHAVIGGGAVGLAIARKLQQRDGVSTVLIEKHGMVGSETSSRNSEVRFSAAQAFLYVRKCERHHTKTWKGNPRWIVLLERQPQDAIMHPRQGDDVRALREKRHPAQQLWQMDCRTDGRSDGRMRESPRLCEVNRSPYSILAPR